MKRSVRLLMPFLFVTIFTFAQCKKDNTQKPDNPYGLPNATQTGANIFACRINGSNWISEKGLYKMGGGVYADTLNCWGTANGDIISIMIVTAASQGDQFILSAGSNSFIRFSTFYTCTGFQNTILLQNSTDGTVSITKIDRTNKIISGIFSCRIPIPNCDTLHITDGRFDYSYN